MKIDDRSFPGAPSIDNGTNLTWPPAAALCTDEQLSAVADEYVAIMLARGFKIGPAERVAVLRAVGIQDAWRVAFARCLK